MPLSAVVVIAGDWNFAADGDRSFAMADAEACFTSSAPPHKRQHAVPWSSVLAGCTDIHAKFMTHWSETFCSASRLDRVYVSLPVWALISAAVSASVIGDTLSPANRGVSDHVPVKIVFARPARPAADQPVPPWICKLPCFKAFLDEIVTYLRVNGLAGVERWAMHKVAIREAAKQARNASLAGLASSPQSKLMVHYPHFVVI